MSRQSMVVQIDGMTCEHCVRAVTSALRAIEGVSDVEVSLAEKSATIHYDADSPDIGQMRTALEQEGYRFLG